MSHDVFTGDPDEQEAREVQAETLRRSRTLGGGLRGGYTRVASRDVLPTASDLLAYALVVLRGTPDIAYICLRDASGAWEWTEIASGT